MTRSEAGKLGYLKSKEKQECSFRNRIQEYEKNPKKCKNCEKGLPYENRHLIFCNQACSAIYNNKQRRNARLCASCGKTLEKQRKFCSKKCSVEYRYKEYIQSWLRGEVPGNYSNGVGVSKAIHRWVEENQGHVCAICGLHEWLNQPIPLTLDHIDGNSQNNTPENFRLICSNCDRLQPTWGGHNRGKGRWSRRQRYITGKSY